ncbi:MAG: glycosyltransferase family 4 protein [Candidatus Gygaella obscura]|nr:glycosyltransferase family 4 protein [Candidatus Gygaella obscura]
MMKILFIVHNFLPYSFAGTEVYAYNLAKELAKKHEVFIFHRVNDSSIAEYELSKDYFDGLTVFKMNNTCRSYNSFEDLYFNKNIEKVFLNVFEQVRPDIVHIQHLLFLSVGIINLIKKSNIPIALTVNDYWLLCPQGQLLKKDLTNCSNVNNLECISCINGLINIKEGVLRRYYFLRKVLPSFLLKLMRKVYLFLQGQDLPAALDKVSKRQEFIKNALSNVDCFIFPSKYVLDKFNKHKIEGTRCLLSNYGINKKGLKGLVKKVSSVLRFGFIGSIHPAKGLHVLLEAFKNITDDEIELKIYGKDISYSGFEDYSKRLKLRFKKDNIHFLGSFDNRQIVDILSEIDILVFPSIWQENYPLTILEALSVNIPVIASRIGGIPEVIRDGDNGILFTPNDHNDLLRCLKMFINDRALIKRFANSSSSVKAIEEDAVELEEVYSSLN